MSFLIMPHKIEMLEIYLNRKYRLESMYKFNMLEIVINAKFSADNKEDLFIHNQRCGESE